MSVYVDLNTKFQPLSNVSKAVLKDLENVRDSLERLLSTPKGSVPFNREYGTSLKSLLFENNVDYHTVRTFLYMDISKWEPRISLNLSDILFDRIDLHTIAVECHFIVPAVSGVRGVTSMTLSDE